MNNRFLNHHHYMPNYYSDYSYRIRQGDPVIFMDSARQTQVLLNDSSLILQKLSSSRSFAQSIITAAQNSQKDLVTQLIRSIGIKNIPKVSYTPNGLILNFVSEKNNIDCCHLTLKIRWGNP
jgi:hypothetical protein